MKRLLGLLIIGFLLIPVEARAGLTTLYMRSDTQTINGILGYKEQDNNSSTSTDWIQICGDSVGGFPTSYSLSATIDVIHSDSSITNIATGVASRTSIDSSITEYQDNWSCSGFSLSHTDAIRITETLSCSYSDNSTLSWTRVFITNQLGWGGINPSTWTFNRWLGLQITQLQPGILSLLFHYQHGDSTYDSMVEGITYNLGGSYAFIMD